MPRTPHQFPWAAALLLPASKAAPWQPAWAGGAPGGGRRALGPSADQEHPGGRFVPQSDSRGWDPHSLRKPLCLINAPRPYENKLLPFEILSDHSLRVRNRMIGGTKDVAVTLEDKLV